MILENNPHMNIIYIGDTGVECRSDMIRRALESMGHNVFCISTNEIPESRSLYPRIRNKLGYPIDLCSVNKKILSEELPKMIDVIWTIKALTLLPSSLAFLREKYPTAFFISSSEDDMMRRNNRSHYYVRCIPYYDLICTNKRILSQPSELPSLRANRIEFIGNYYNSEIHKPVIVSAEDIARYRSSVSFIGTYETPRAKSLLKLAKAGIPLRIWGNHWPAKLKHLHPNIEINGLLPHLEYVKAICVSQINLCFLRKRNRDTQTARSIEIPACGGFMLAERTKEHLELFKDGKEAAFFSNDSELIEKCKYYLSHPDLISEIGRRGREKCLNGEQEIHSIVKKVLSLTGKI
jgi:spore maturation protein CgeB